MFSRIERKETFTVVGTQVIAPCGEVPNPHIHPIVIKFFQNKDGVKNVVNQTGYGIIFDQDKEKFTYVFGQEVSKVEDIPECMVTKEVEGFDYAVIAHKGLLKNLGEACKYFHETWLPQSGYEHVKERPFFEVYGKDFKGGDNEDSILEIYYPVKKIEGGENPQ